MNINPPWIASFVQQCLSFFLDGGKPKHIDVEDDGASLSFRVHRLSGKAKVANVCVSLCEIGARCSQIGIY